VHDVVFIIAMLWLMGLVALLIGFAARARRLAHQMVALDAIALVFIAALALVAIAQREPGYLDVALVLALLGFVQTVGIGRLVQGRRDL